MIQQDPEKAPATNEETKEQAEKDPKEKQVEKSPEVTE